MTSIAFRLRRLNLARTGGRLAAPTRGGVRRDHTALRAALLAGLLAALSAPFPAAAQTDAPAAPAAPADGEGAAATRREPVLEYVIADGATIAEPLTDAPGDAARGRELFAGAAGCAACHAVDVGAPPGSGPSLAGVGGRLSSGAIRLWIVNPRAFVVDATMPAYYSLWPERPAAPDEDPPRLEPLLSAQEVEDLTAYLNGLTAIVGGGGE